MKLLSAVVWKTESYWCSIQDIYPTPLQLEVSNLKADVWQLQTDISAEKANKKAVEAKLSEMKLKLDNCNSSYQRELESSKDNLAKSRSQMQVLNEKFGDVSHTADELTKKVRQLGTLTLTT